MKEENVSLLLYSLAVVHLILWISPIFALPLKNSTKVPRFRSGEFAKEEIVSLGERLKLRCVAPPPFGDKKSLSVQWYKNNRLISVAYANHRRYKPSGSSLIINRIEPGDDGDYACNVLNQSAEIWKNYTVKIGDLDEWKQRMIDRRNRYLENSTSNSNETCTVCRIAIVGNAYDHVIPITCFFASAFFITLAVFVYKKFSKRKKIVANRNPVKGKSEFAEKLDRKSTLFSDESTCTTPTVTIATPIPFDSDSCPLECELPVDPDWEIPRNRLKVLLPIGEGSFGRVFEGCLKNDAAPPGDRIRRVAVKMLKPSAKYQDLKDLEQEMELLKQIGQHENVIDLIGCCTQHGPLYLLVEYCENGSLLTYLRQQRPDSQETRSTISKTTKPLTQQCLIQFGLQVARGMAYLSNKMITHRDLAARNIFVTKDLIMKIGDFGLARDITPSDYYRQQTEGRLPVKWMSPEALSERKFSVKSDVWSYGVVLWETMTLGGTPYPCLRMEDMFEVLQKGHRMCKPENCLDEIYTLMTERCWQDEPEMRWTFGEIVKYLETVLMSTESADYLTVVDENTVENYYY